MADEDTSGQFEDGSEEQTENRMEDRSGAAGGPEVTEDPESFANGVSNFLKDLGEIAACLALNQNRGYTHLEIEQGHSLRQVLERELHR